jgi:hypothetical protein
MRELRRRAVTLAAESLAFGPATVAFVRETCNGEALTLAAMASDHLRAYRTWQRRVQEVANLVCAQRNDDRSRSLKAPDMYGRRMSEAGMA